MILHHYGLLAAARCRTGEYILRCVFHDETHASLSINENGLFQCFGCTTSGGDIIDFVAQKEGVSLRQAAVMIDTWFPADGMPHVPQQEEPPEVIAAMPTEDRPPAEVLYNPPLDYTLCVDPDHPYLGERGLQPATVKEFCIGMCTSERSMMAGRIIIPITYWDPVTNDAYLVAHAGRVPDDPPDANIDKYLFPPDFHKSAVVYNLIGAGRYAREQGLILTEGFFSVMRLWQFGVRTAVSIMGNSLSKQQEELIVNTVGIGSGKVTLMFDPDDAGRRCRDDVLNRLIRKVSVRVVDLDEPPDELSERALHAALHL
jgi:DNA primase